MSAFIGAVAGGLVALAVLAGCATTEPRAPSADGRQRLTLPAAQRDAVLAEMRHMLGSLTGIVQGLGAGDATGAEKAARASGMAVAVDVDPELKKLLPQAFLQLGMQTHRGFDDLADRIKAGATTQEALKSLASLAANCVACHATYRLDEAR
jgi:cytochrome c556